MEDLFKKFYKYQRVLNEIKDIQGSISKTILLKNALADEGFKELLIHLFSPTVTTGIAKTAWKKVEGESVYSSYEKFKSPNELITFIQNNNTGKQEVVKEIKDFATLHHDLENIIYWIATKDIKIGLNIDTIKKYVPLHTHDVMLGTSLKELTKGIEENREYVLTEKLDGIFCSTRVEDGTVTFTSRNGKPILGLTDLEKEYSQKPNGWYHGELLYDGEAEDRKALYRKTVSEVNADKENKKVVHRLFSFTKLEDWQNETSITYKEELEQLKLVVNDKNIFLVQEIGRGTGSDYAVSELQRIKETTDWEGLMLRYLDSKYEFKRSKNLIKLKQSYTLDLKIIGFEEGSGKYENQLGAFIVDYKGFPLGVGSGLKEDERIDFWNRKDELLGKIIEISYWDETHDVDGKPSLRFPVFERLRLDKDSESYN